MPSTTSDNLSKEDIPEVFLKKKVLPGLMGFLAYKAAALVQVYRDNEDLRLILPEEEDADSHSA
nr:unnamed protein product [Digitaria exilis]